MYELGCTVRVDELGFFIYWKSDGKVGAVGFLPRCMRICLSVSMSVRPSHVWIVTKR